jgi:hypothetical protein
VTASEAKKEIMARGALVFKGDAAPKKKSKKNKHSKTNIVAETPPLEQHSVLPPVIRPQQRTITQEQEVPSMKEGTGRITISGTVVTGIGTRFEKELNQGDALIIGAGESQEMRVVTMRLSNTSCAISSSFGENCKLPTPFFVIRKPRNKEKEARSQLLKEQQEKYEVEQQAFGTYQGDELVYREKTEHGNYRIKRVKVDESTTRGDLLSMRTQKKSDKYC